MIGQHLLVCAFADVRDTQRILEQYFGAHPDGTILFENKYFKATVTLRIVYEPEHDLLLSEDTWKGNLPYFPAVVLLSADQQPASISKCKTLWDRMRRLISEDAIRIFFLDGNDLNEKDTYGLVEWGVTRQIEVVNMFLSKEDNGGLSVRLKRTLECAPWPNISHNIAQDDENIPESQLKAVVKDEHREHATDRSDLSKPTRLRRGLQKSDVSKLVDDLLLADDSNSDT